ncbi:MAG: CopG family transcriptional regulator [Rhodospirillales bacterium]
MHILSYEVRMSVRFNVVLSDDLNRAIDQAAEESETNKSEILRKALQLFLAAREGTKRGLKLGLVEPESEKLQTEIVGL